MRQTDSLASIGNKKIRNYLNQRRSTIIKFLIVSGSAVLLNLFLLYLLVNYLGFISPLKQNFANVISIELSVIYNFFVSRAITWKERPCETGLKLAIQILKFHVTIGITLLFRLGLFALLQMIGIHYLINAVIGIAVSAVFNFFIYDSLIFKKGES